MKRKAVVAAAGAGAAFLLLVIAARGQAPAPAAPLAKPQAGFDVGLPTAQEVRNMLAVYGERVDGAERELAALRTRIEEAEKRAEAGRTEDRSALERLLADLRPAAPTAAPAPPPAPRFRTVEFERRSGRSLHVPAGSFGEATLLTGVFAPVSGEPLPVLLRLDAALVGPQRSRVPIRGAFLVGKAQGDANSRRAVVQIETLSALRADGSPSETRVNGWVADEDGIQGLRGNYVWRADELVLLSSLAGGLSGGAEAFAQRETSSQVTPLGGVQGAVTGDPVRFAGFRAAASALGRLGEAVSQRMEEVVPAIHVPNARRVTVAFIAGATLEGVEAPGTTESPFEGLDR